MARRVLRPHEKTAPHPALSEPAAVPSTAVQGSPTTWPSGLVADEDRWARESEAAIRYAIGQTQLRSANEAAERAELYRQQLLGEWTAQRVVRPRAEVEREFGIDFARLAVDLRRLRR